MSEKFGMVQLEDMTGEYLDRRTYLNCSDETAADIDTEVRNIINKAYKKAYILLKKNEKILDAIAAYLIEHETITGEEFMRIYNEVAKKHRVYSELSAAERLEIEESVKQSKVSKVAKTLKAEIKAAAKVGKKKKKTKVKPEVEETYTSQDVGPELPNYDVDVPGEDTEPIYEGMEGPVEDPSDEELAPKEVKMPWEK